MSRKRLSRPTKASDITLVRLTVRAYESIASMWFNFEPHGSKIDHRWFLFEPVVRLGVSVS